MAVQRSPGTKLFLVGLAAAILALPLLAVYALVYDREQQSDTAQREITAGWGANQVVSGPVVVLPYLKQETQVETDGERPVTRSVETRGELYLSPSTQAISTALAPQKRSKSIYTSVIYRAALSGTAHFELPGELGLRGVRREQLLLGEAQLRFGVSDPRGLQNDARVTLGGSPLALQPGNGVASSGGFGFHSDFDWSGARPLAIAWSYGLRGSRSLALVPRGGNTEWKVTSAWPHPGFGGKFLPEKSTVTDHGFTATYGVPNLALGQPILTDSELGPPEEQTASYPATIISVGPNVSSGASMAAGIRLVDPVDLYSRVNRSVKYGFLFIGFTFLAFLMFDVVGGSRVSTAEYLMTGAGLVLFFALLLAFAEVIGFAAAYAVASVAIIGLLTAYSAAVLRSWRRARFVGALLVVLYALIYVLLSLEAFSLLIGSVLLFLALAGVMYGTRNVDWSSVGQTREDEEVSAG
jgi:inner membrane protein